MLDPKASFGTFPVCNGDQTLSETAHVEMPRVTSVCPSPTKLVGVGLAQLQTPLAHRFVGHQDAAFSEQVLNISITQGEAVGEPDGVSDDLLWQAEAFVRRVSVWMAAGSKYRMDSAARWRMANNLPIPTVQGLRTVSLDTGAANTRARAFCHRMGDAEERVKRITVVRK